MATEPMTVEQAAESLLIMPETKTEAGETETPEPEEAETEEAPGADQTDEVEAEADGEDAEVAGDDSDQEDEADEDDAEDAELADYHTVKVDGEEVQVTLDDLKRGYSGQAYIQKQMRDNAEQRKAIEAAQAEITQARAQVVQLWQQMQQAPEDFRAPVPPSRDQFQTDPIGYMEAKMQYEEDAAAFEQKRQQMQHALTEQQQAEAGQRQAYLQEQAAALRAAIPEFADPEKGAQLSNRILTAASEHYGFTREELGGVMDARQIQVLNDARKWRELQASKSQVTAKAAKEARPVVKAAAKRKTDPRKAERDKLRKRLKQTGSLQDAAALILDQG